MIEILDCGHPPTETEGPGTGYAVNGDTKKKICYNCAAEQDKEWMRKHGKIMLYFTYSMKGPAIVTNWPGTLKFEIPHWKIKISHHNWAGIRYDFWFNFEGDTWHGYRCGDQHEICHCQRTKGYM